MELDEQYRKRNIAQMLIETSGWTTDAPEYVESRVVFSEKVLDSKQVEAIRAVYPALV